MEEQINEQQPNYQQKISEPSVVNIYQNNNRENEVVSLRDWIITLILTAIPVVGFICLLVWALGDSTPISKKNWAKANLIVMIAFAVIAIVLLILFWGLITAAIASSSNQ